MLILFDKDSRLSGHWLKLSPVCRRHGRLPFLIFCDTPHAATSAVCAAAHSKARRTYVTVTSGTCTRSSPCAPVVFMDFCRSSLTGPVVVALKWQVLQANKGTEAMHKLGWCLIALLVIGTEQARALQSAAGTIPLDEASIADLNAAFRAGSLTSEQLVQLFLGRIDRYDKRGPSLRAIISLNPKALETAVSSMRNGRPKAHGQPCMEFRSF